MQNLIKPLEFSEKGLFRQSQRDASQARVYERPVHAVVRGAILQEEE